MGVAGCVFSARAGQPPFTAQTLGAAGFRSSADPSSVISGEVFALLLIATYMRRADDKRKEKKHDKFYSSDQWDDDDHRQLPRSWVHGSQRCSHHNCAVAQVGRHIGGRATDYYQVDEHGPDQRVAYGRCTPRYEGTRRHDSIVR